MAQRQVFGQQAIMTCTFTDSLSIRVRYGLRFRRRHHLSRCLWNCVGINLSEVWATSSVFQVSKLNVDRPYRCDSRWDVSCNSKIAWRGQWPLRSTYQRYLFPARPFPFWTRPSLSTRPSQPSISRRPEPADRLLCPASSVRWCFPSRIQNEYIFFLISEPRELSVRLACFFK